MEITADMDCCLKVYSECQCCVMKTIEVLRAIRGVYSVDWDAEQSNIRIRGEVNPNLLMKAVMATGEHAELLSVKLNHPQLRHNYYNNSYNRSSYTDHPYYRYQTNNFGYPNHPYYRYQTSNYEYPNHPYYRYQTSNGEYPYGRRLQPPAIEYLLSSYDYQTPLPRAAYVPSYPPQEYDPYANYEGISFCSIM